MSSKLSMNNNNKFLLSTVLAGVLVNTANACYGCEYEYESYNATTTAVGVVFGVMFCVCICAAGTFNYFKQQRIRRAAFIRRNNRPVVQQVQPVAVVVQPKVVTATAIPVQQPALVTAHAQPVGMGQQQYVTAQVQQPGVVYGQQPVYAQQQGVYSQQNVVYGQQQQPAVNFAQQQPYAG